MRRGTIVWVNLEDTAPPEFGKTRPGIVVSNSEQNSILETVVIVPLSSRPPEIWPLRLRVEFPKKKVSFAVITGIRQVSRARLLEIAGLAPAEFIANLNRALAAYLAL
ncbi:MAG: type II toxin-antitoxin system PemK/MazF family toxin [Chthoniobacterales bacterium]